MGGTTTRRRLQVPLTLTLVLVFLPFAQKNSQVERELWRQSSVIWGLMSGRLSDHLRSPSSPGNSTIAGSRYTMFMEGSNKAESARPLVLRSSFYSQATLGKNTGTEMAGPRMALLPTVEK